MNFLLLVVACAVPDEREGGLGAGSDEIPIATGFGHLSIAFDIDPDVAKAMESEEPVGRFSGALFRAEDVDVLGPKEGVTAIQPIVVEVDLRGDRPTPPLLTSQDVAPQWVAILGFLDTDGNADTPAPMPEHGDPCTLPTDNEFEVTPEGVTAATVSLGILFYD